MAAALSSAVAEIDFTRQSNRLSGVPLHNFRGGVTSLAKVKSQEYPSVVLVLVLCLGTKDKYLPTEKTLQVQYALSGLYLLWFFLKRFWIRRSELLRLPGLVCRYVVYRLLKLNCRERRVLLLLRQRPAWL